MVNIPSNSFYLISPLVAAGVVILLAAIVLYKDSRSLTNRLFFIVLLTMVIWNLFTFFMRISPDTERALYWDRLIFPAGIATGVCYYHFILVYTRSENNKMLWIGYSLLIVSFVLSIAGFQGFRRVLK